MRGHSSRGTAEPREQLMNKPVLREGYQKRFQKEVFVSVAQWRGGQQRGAKRE